MIDILMATYNGELYIKEQIESILNQTYKDWKLYIRDDKSKDQTLNVIKKYTKEYPDKIILIEDNLGGLGAKKNFSQLLKYSKNEYCMFCDQDDVWLQDKIKISLDEIQKAESVYDKSTPILVHTDLKVVNEKLEIINESYWQFQGLDSKYSGLNKLLVENNITGCTVIINKSLKSKVQEVPEEAIMHDWWIGLVAGTLGKIIQIDNKTILYRQHSNNVVGASGINSIKNISSKLDKKQINSSIYKGICQGKKFYEMYKNVITEEHKSIIMNFINLKQQNYLNRKKIIIKNKFYKYNKIKRIAYILFS